MTLPLTKHYAQGRYQDNPGSHESPAESGPGKPSRNCRTDNSFRCFSFWQRQGNNFPTFAASGEVFDHNIALNFGQRPLGEGGQHIRVRMIRGRAVAAFNRSRTIFGTFCIKSASG